MDNCHEKHYEKNIQDWSKTMKNLNKFIVFIIRKAIISIFAILVSAFVFTACNKKPAPFTDLNAVSTHISKAKGGTLDKPINIIVDIPLGDVTNTGSGWQRLLMIIENAGKNVALDLSACQMTNTEFNPVINVNTGKFFIVSLVLPVAAKSIIGGDWDAPSFTHFYNLKTVSAKEVTSIGSYAFFNCTSLISTDFPMVASISDCAFNGCTSLKNVSMSLVTSIGGNAFSDCSSLTSISIPLVTSIDGAAFALCTSLTSVNFPASALLGNFNPFAGCINLTSFTLNGTGNLSVIEDGKALIRGGTELITYPSASGNIVMNNITNIGEGAFNGNSNLTNVSFPLVTSIGDFAFLHCTSLTSASFPAATSIGILTFACTGTTALTITLGNKAPTVGSNMFFEVTGVKPVTVKVPFGATGYGQSPVNATARNWGNYFRGGEWSSSKDWWGDTTWTRTTAPNTNIELKIEYMTDAASL